MPKGVPNKRYALKFKKLVVETMQKEKLSYRETARTFEISNHHIIQAWKQIYLAEEPDASILRPCENARLYARPSQGLWAFQKTVRVFRYPLSLPPKGNGLMRDLNHQKSPQLTQHSRAKNPMNHLLFSFSSVLGVFHRTERICRRTAKASEQ